MKKETKLALTIFICAALISGALTIRDGGLTGLATEGTNLVPEYTTTTLSTHSDTALTVDLSKYFTDPDGDTLTFLATDEDMVKVSVDGSIATFVPAPGFAGERVITIVATDGTNVVRAPMKLVVGSPAEEPAIQTEAPAEEEPVVQTGITGTGTTDAGITVTCNSCADCTTCTETQGNTCTLVNDISSADNCTHIRNDNITLECDGHTIAYNTDGGNYEWGVSSSDHINLTIKDCIIKDTTYSGSEGYGIIINKTNYTTIINNTVITNGTTGYGIYLEGPVYGSIVSSHNNTVSDNTVLSYTESLPRGIFFYHIVSESNITHNVISLNHSGFGLYFGFGYRNNISNNNVTMNGPGNGHAFYTDGLYQAIILNNLLINNGTHSSNNGIYGACNYSTITYNTINVTGTTNLYGIYLNPAGSNTIANNNITVNGTSTNVGLEVREKYNVVENNTIVVNGTSTYGVHLRNYASYNNITGNRITLLPGLGSSYGLYLNDYISNNTISFNNISVIGGTTANSNYGIYFRYSNSSEFIANTIINAPRWMIYEQDCRNNFTNTTFATNYGSINFPERSELNGSVGPTQSTLNITNNRAYLNTNSLPYLNKTGIITLNSISFSDPKPMVDWDDDGNYEDCPGEVCEELNYTGMTYVFNVSHFTGFSSSEVGIMNLSNLTISKTGSPDIVNASSNLTYRINVNITGNGTSYNVTVNDTYPAQVIYLASEPAPVPPTNNTWVLGNLTPGTNISINITVLVRNITNGTVINNTANVTFQNETSGLLSASASKSNMVLNPPVFNFTNVSVTKTSSPDPAYVSTNLTYQVNVSTTGNGTAHNVTVNDTYPAQVIYLASEPAPVPPTNNTWVLGNLTPGTNISINITVLVRNVSDNTIINNTVNVTFQNETSAWLSANTSQSTSVLNLSVNYFSNISVVKTGSPDPVAPGDTLSYTLTVTSTGNNTAFDVVVNDTYPAQVIYLASEPAPVPPTNNTWVLGNLTPGTIIAVNITVIVPASVQSGTVLNNTVNATFQNSTGALLSGNASASTTVLAPVPPAPGGGGGGGGRIVPRNVVLPELAPSMECVESWECEDWSRCSEGIQFRTCVDVNNCNKTKNLPQTERKCVPERAVGEVSAEKAPVLEMPALQPVSEQVRASVPVAGAMTLCSMLPMSLSAALIIAGLLALVSLLVGRERRLLKRWSLPVDALLVICLVLAVWHYVSCKELLLIETIALGVLALFVMTLRVADYIASRRPSEEESMAQVIEQEAMPVPEPEAEVPVPEEIPVPEPEKAPMPEEMPQPVEVPKPAKMPEMPPERPGMARVYVPMLEEVVRRKKPARKVIITSPKKQKRRKQLKVKVAPPVFEEEMRDWREVVRRTGKTLRKLDTTLRRLKKKK